MSPKIRRCAIVLIEPREQAEFDLDDLLGGGGGVRVVPELVALAPHLDAAVPFDAGEAALLQRVRASEWHAPEGYEADGALASLVAKGLVFTEDAPADSRRERDEKLRARHWYPHAAVLHYFGRWSDVDAERNTDLIGLRRQSDLVAKFGPPPPAVAERAATSRTALGRGTMPDLDDVLRRRVTCRNFAREVAMPRAAFDAVLDTALAARAVHAV